MAGKIIVTAPKEIMGIQKLKIYINEDEQDVLLKRGEVHEFEINRESEIYGQFKPASLMKSQTTIAFDGYVTEIAFRIKSGFVNKLEAIKISETPVNEYAKEAQKQDVPIYAIKGARGRRLSVYEDKCIITTVAGLGSFITGNGSDGEKTIYYSDVLSVQYKRSGIQLGYLQLETASSTMNNKSDNFFNENSFTFDSNVGLEMEEVQKYIKQKVEESKKQKNAPIVVANELSAADELKKFKELLDLGIITQEEFDAKKKQLLGL